MIRVMVIEDEPPILRAICQKIERAGSCYQVVETAGNGQEGIEKIKQNPELDLVFVDINLPVISGIGVLDYISKNRPGLMSVVLSGYKDFDYVKNAYERKTIEYLLKPLKEEELKKLLRRVETLYLEKISLNRRKSLEEALSSPGREGESGEEQRTHDKKQSRKQYYMVLVTLDSYSNSLLGNGIDYMHLMEELRLKEKMAAVFSPDAHWIIEGKSELDRILFVEKSEEEAFKKMERIYERLGECPVPVTMAVNTTSLEAGEVYDTYYKMRKYVEEQMIFARSSLLFYDGFGMEPIFGGERARVDKALSRCKKSGEERVIGEELIRMMEDVTLSPTKQSEVLYMVRRFFSVLCSVIPCNKEYVQVEEEIGFILLNRSSLEEMKQQLLRLVDDCFGKKKVEVKDKELLAMEMKAYLEANYHLGISNQMIAAKFGFVPTYLSSIFKEYYHVSLGDYLIRLRIEQAKELLTGSDLMIKEIAEKTGYRDAFYFSKAFKKAVGVSPKEFMEEKRCLCKAAYDSGIKR